MSLVVSIKGVGVDFLWGGIQPFNYQLLKPVNEYTPSTKIFFFSLEGV